jgi:Intracellular proteinase inhibitor
MKKTFLFVFFIVVLVSYLAFVGSLHLGAAQSSTPTPTPIATVASGGNGDLELTMALDKTIYNLGEPVNLTLTITNISNQTINFTHTGYDFDFQVTNDTNNQVYKWSNFQAFPDIVSITPLQAGKSFSANFTWLQTCNFNVSVENYPVSPGTYNIFGQTGPTYGIQTTPIQLTISGTSTSPTLSPSSSPSQSPAVPEFPTLTILPLFALSAFLSIVFIKKSQKIIRSFTHSIESFGAH